MNYKAAGSAALLMMIVGCTSQSQPDAAPVSPVETAKQTQTAALEGGSAACGTISFGKSDDQIALPLRCLQGTYGSDEDPNNPRSLGPTAALSAVDYVLPAGVSDQLAAYWMNSGDNLHGILLLGPKGWVANTASVGANGSVDIRLADPHDETAYVSYFDNGGCQGCLISNIGSYFPELKDWSEQQGFPAKDLPDVTERTPINASLMAYKKKPSADGYDLSGTAFQQHDDGGGFFRTEEVQLKAEEQASRDAILGLFEFDMQNPAAG